MIAAGCAALPGPLERASTAALAGRAEQAIAEESADTSDAPQVRGDPATQAKPNLPDQPSERDLAFMTRYRFTADHVGYLVFDPADGRVLASRNANRPFMPASIAKVPTTVMALEVLGPDHRFITRLMATGPVRAGVLDGDLYLVGGGDPLLEPLDLARMANRLKAQGIRRITGRFVYDESLLIGRPQIEQSQPEDAGYNPGLGALSVAFNRIRLRWRRGGAAGGLVVEAVSHSDRSEVPLDNVTVRRAPYRKDAWQAFYYDGQSVGARPGPRWLIDPRQGPEGSAWLPVKRPGAYTAEVFRRLAAVRGMALPQPVPGVVPDRARLLTHHRSRRLVDTVRASLKFSNNLTAELVGLASSAEIAGRPTTLSESGDVLGAWFRERAPEVDWSGFAFRNHSGLTPDSQTSPAQFAAMVRYAIAQRYGRKSYLSLVPFEGWPGNKRLRRMVRIRAKSGTMDYVRTLAGQAYVYRDRPLGFVLFINDVERRRAHDADPRRRQPWMRARARAWLRRAKALEEALVRSWMEQFGRHETRATRPASRRG